MSGPWIDTHCHLQMLDDADAAVAGALAAGVERIVCVGIDEDSSRQAIALAETHNDVVYATVGLHPHDASRFDAQWEALVALADSVEVVAIGECGLDFHHDLSPRVDQEDAFLAQVQLAKDLGAALVVHTRDAWDATLPLLEDVGIPERTVFHCFSGGPAEAERCAALGAYVSFAGPVGYPSAGVLREAAGVVPHDRLVVETDAPFLSPQEFRGQPNLPERVGLVGEALAAALSMNAGEVAALTSRNAARLFGFTW